MVAAAGNTVFPMKNLTIMDTSENSHSILKTYEPSRGSIGSISVEDYTITIHLIKKSGGHYVAAGTDAIMNREGDTEEKVTVGSTVTDRKETQYQLMMKNGADASKIKMLTSKSVLLENPRDVSVKNKESQEYFYVYKKVMCCLQPMRSRMPSSAPIIIWGLWWIPSSSMYGCVRVNRHRRHLAA